MGTTVSRESDIREMLGEGLRVREIAQKLGVTAATIYKDIEAYGIKLPGRRYRPPDYADDVVRLYNEGQPIAKISEALGVNKYKVYAVLRNEGVTMRPPAPRTVDRESIIESYNRTKSVRATARELGLHDATVTRITVEAGIYRPQRHTFGIQKSNDPKIIAQVMAMRRSGMKIIQIARELGLSRVVVNRAIYNAEHGIAGGETNVATE